jgi:fructose-1,6-bisphosphatase II
MRETGEISGPHSTGCRSGPALQQEAAVSDSSPFPASSLATDHVPFETRPLAHPPEALWLAPGFQLELVRVTQAAAIAAIEWVGRGDKNHADGAAVRAMRQAIRNLPMSGRVVIGEGEKDDAPMLFNGEAVGNGDGPACDIAVDPIDGTRLTARGVENAVSVLAVAEGGSMFDPSAVFYMDKLVVGAGAADVVDITAPPRENVRRVAQALHTAPGDVTVAILDRPRHASLIEEVRDAGARIKLIADGDVLGAIAAAREGSGVDLLLGIGGTPEGVLAACAIKSMGGVIQAKLTAHDDDERQRALDAGHDLDSVLLTDDLISGNNVLFLATGITRGDLLRGASRHKDQWVTHSLITDARDRSVHFLESWTSSVPDIARGTRVD